jgi:hypothetical protein
MSMVTFPRIPITCQAINAAQAFDDKKQDIVLAYSLKPSYVY